MDTMKTERKAMIETQKVNGLLYDVSARIKNIVGDGEISPMKVGYELGLLNEIIYNWVANTLYPIEKEKEEDEEE